jgi:hypothetical protein
MLNIMTSNQDGHQAKKKEKRGMKFKKIFSSSNSEAH